MKKYIAICCALAALLACACTKFAGTPGEEETPREGLILKLEPTGISLRTKADDPTRVGDYDGAFHENNLGDQVDVFFFRSGADDDTPSVWNDRVNVSSNGYLRMDASTASIITIFGSNTQNADALVLVVANYNGSAAIDHSGHYTVNQLRALQLATATWKTTLPVNNDNFVMMSEKDGSPLVPIVLTAPGSATPASATVPMKRVAAKVSFRLTVADEITVVNIKRDQSGGIVGRELETWSPLKKQMTAYMFYAMKRGYLGGAPQTPPVDPPLATISDDYEDIFQYNSRKLVETEETVDRTRTPVTGLNTDVDPPVPIYGEPVTSAFNVYQVVSDEDNSGPFYTYPVTWEAGAAGEPFIKLIIPWNNGTSTKYYYYKVPFKSAPLESNHWYEITLDVQILGGEDTDPVPLEASYKVVDWVPGVDFTATVNDARYLSVPTRSFTMYNTEDLEIPIVSSHDCEIVSVSVTKHNYKTNQDVSYTLAADALTVSRDAIEFEHALNNEMGDDLDCAPYYITFRVRHADDTSYYADITIVQYPAIYMGSTEGGNAFVDGYYGHVNGNHHYSSGNYSNAYNTYEMPYGVLRDRVDATDNTNMTIITVTSLSEESSTFSYTVNNSGIETYDYIITDPRTTAKSWSTLTAYWGGSDAVAWTSDMVSKIKVASPEYNYIAPQFMISSMWGRNYGSTDLTSLERAQQRCATYQEAGYPAGRWRLPTDAEVMFVVNLQRYGFIDNLFVGYYWTSNGSRLNGTDMNNVTVTRNYSGSNSIRCVYDTWYWGTDPVADEYTYTIWPDRNTEPIKAAKVN